MISILRQSMQSLLGFKQKEISSKKSTSSWRAKLAFVLVIGAIISGFATYGALTGSNPADNNPKKILWLLNIDLVIAIALVTLIARRVITLLGTRRRGIRGSRLHVRLVLVFCLLAATPAILMTFFSAYFLHFGVDRWFSEQVKTAVTKSEAVAEAYLKEHYQIIRADINAMAKDIDTQAAYLYSDDTRFQKVIDTQSLLRNFSEAIIFDSSGRVLSQSSLTFTLTIDSLPHYVMLQAKNGEVVVMTGDTDDRVRAVTKLNNISDAYLFVGRLVDPIVLGYLADTKKAVEDYTTLENEKLGIQVKISIIFIVIALLLLFTAIWFGLAFARQLVAPISDLIATADRVRSGDLNARVPHFNRKDEFDFLGKSFNRMTNQIQEQRDELVTANRQLDQRRQFTETVLSGVSSGIIAINSQGKITILNPAAEKFFSVNAVDTLSQPISGFFDDIQEYIDKAYESPERITQFETRHSLPSGEKRVLLIRITVDKSHASNTDRGAVITFNDITELQVAQRKAAWSDVARRIAHEIKNPLTPIQLSAERLKRKYLSQITDDQHIFEQCTDTIIQHVGDIGHMVNEFSNFARMPEPKMEQQDLRRILHSVIVMNMQAHPDIRFNLHSGFLTQNNKFTHVFDPQQIRQVLVNVMQNAIDSVLEKKETDETYQPEIDFILDKTNESQTIFVSIIDNGLGLPDVEENTSLTDPYVTKKPKGTGLGLSIVKKIMDDHGGELLLTAPEWLLAKVPDLKISKDTGACVTFTLPANEKTVHNTQKSVA